MAQEALSQKEARRTGKKAYQMQNPCIRGHLGLRTTAAGVCIDCTRRWRRDPARSIFDASRIRARLHVLPFTITIEDVRAAWPANNKCPIFGTTLAHGDGKNTPNSPSLDRLRAGLGYVPGNIAVISLRANRIKQNETEPSVFRRMADWLELALS